MEENEQITGTGISRRARWRGSAGSQRPRWVPAPGRPPTTTQTPQQSAGRRGIGCRHVHPAAGADRGPVLHRRRQAPAQHHRGQGGREADAPASRLWTRPHASRSGARQWTSGTRTRRVFRLRCRCLEPDLPARRAAHRRQRLAVFQTIYPGWSGPRGAHPRAGARVGTSHTGQLFFSDKTTDAVYKRSPYARRPNRNPRNTGTRSTSTAAASRPSRFEATGRRLRRPADDGRQPALLPSAPGEQARRLSAERSAVVVRQGASPAGDARGGSRGRADRARPRHSGERTTRYPSARVQGTPLKTSVIFAELVAGVRCERFGVAPGDRVARNGGLHLPVAEATALPVERHARAFDDVLAGARARCTGRRAPRVAEVAVANHGGVPTRLHRRLLLRDPVLEQVLLRQLVVVQLLRSPRGRPPCPSHCRTQPPGC